MKKLLHESMRDGADRAEKERCLYNLTDNDKHIATLCPNEARALAAEIEKYYIPRPRFEDGEPVQLGDEYEWADTSLRRITGFGMTEQGEPYITCAFDGRGICDAKICDGPLKRPEPKVLDADGVEIKEGETLYFTDETSQPGLEHNVAYITFRDDRDRPILVWDIEGGWMPPNKLTHREPDSLEKLLSRMEDYAQKNEGYVDGSKVGDFSKELRAIMERDA